MIHSNSNNFTKWLVCLPLLAACLFPSATLGADNGEISLFPNKSGTKDNRSWFVYDLSPGQAIEDQVTLSNVTDSPITFKLYAADALTTQEGGYTLKNADEISTDIGAWVELTPTANTVAAHSDLDVPFTLTIPVDADVGEHLGGIIVEIINQPKADTGEAFNVNVVTRVGVRIYETVPGEIIEKLELENHLLTTSSSGLVLTLGIHNTGNIKSSPRVDLTVRDMFGKTVLTENDLDLGLIMRGAEMNRELQLHKQLLPGCYTLTGTTRYGNDQTLTFDQYATYLPWWVFGLAALALLLLYFIIWQFVRFVRFINHARKLEKIMTTQQVGTASNLSSGAAKTTNTEPPTETPLSTTPKTDKFQRTAFSLKKNPKGRS